MVLAHFVPVCIRLTAALVDAFLCHLEGPKEAAGAALIAEASARVRAEAEEVGSGKGGTISEARERGKRDFGRGGEELPKSEGGR